MSDGFLESLINSGEDGAALANTTTPTSLLPGGRLWTLPSNYFDRVGKALRLRMAGRMSTVVTTPGTFKFELKFGSIAVADFGALSLNTTAQTNVGWVLEALLLCRSIGKATAATLIAQGIFRSHAVIGSPAPPAGGAGCHILPYNTAPAVGSGFDSTAAQLVDVYGTWSVANASNSLTLHQYSLDAIG